MKDRRKRCLALVMAFVMIGTLIPLSSAREIYQAASSYTNAKEFFESTTSERVSYHAEMTDGTIYYATQAKLASSSTNTRYYTVGFDITLSGNGHSVSFTVQREGGSMTEVNSHKDDTYEYVLYSITDDTLYDLATAADETNAAYVLDTSSIHVVMNAIMVTKVGDTLGGSITEDSSGGFTQTGTIYRLKDSADLKALKDIFTGHDFKSYRDIEEDMENYQLQIRYNILGLDLPGKASAGKGYSLSSSGYLQKDGNTVISSGRILQQMSLLGTDGLGLSKEGYHLSEGKEWLKSDGTVFASGSTHMPKSIELKVGSKDYGLTLYANWKPNTYTVKYDNNGGLGMVPNSSHMYDSLGTLRKNNCYKEGYTLVSGAEWNTKPDGSGKTYGSGQVIKNLTAEDGGVVTLYANWKEATYEVETKKDGGSGGTDVFYEQYTIDWFSNAELKNPINSISKPNKPGYNFVGYFTYYFGMGDPIVDAQGVILQNPDYFNRNSVIYADWEPKTFSVFFDKQGGTGGWDSVTATFDKIVPFAGNSPTQKGYAFQGYFTEKEGKGTRYYNEHMSGEQYYQTDGDMTLFAYWLDETPPIATITAPTVWSNATGGIQILCTAEDKGSGLDKLELYQGSNPIPVVSKSALGGAESVNLNTYYNKTEGVVQYRLVAYDVAKNSAEAYVTVKYDTTAPNGTVTVSSWDYGNFALTVTATDYKIP